MQPNWRDVARGHDIGSSSRMVGVHCVLVSSGSGAIAGSGGGGDFDSSGYFASSPSTVAHGASRNLVVVFSTADPSPVGSVDTIVMPVASITVSSENHQSLAGSSNRVVVRRPSFVVSSMISVPAEKSAS